MNQPYGVSYLDALLGANAAIAGVRGAGATVHLALSLRSTLGHDDRCTHTAHSLTATRDDQRK